MKKWIIAVLTLTLLLCGCGITAPETTEATQAPTTVPETTEPEETTMPEETTVPTEPETTAPTAPEHSELYIPWLTVEDVILYFNEVCLDAEYINSGDPSVLQKWVTPISYEIKGTPTEEDKVVLENFCTWLNTVEGFPGIALSDGTYMADMTIHFCPRSEMTTILGDNFADMDGGVIFWYNGADQIYQETICYVTEIGQYTRNSVILEEIYNGLGPIQDTDLRQESIIYSGFSEPQALHAVDELLLKLLYHPDMKCGMTAQECEAVIRQLYY